MLKKALVATLQALLVVGATSPTFAAPSNRGKVSDGPFQHVLLISIDGMRAHDDTNVMMLFSNPSFKPNYVNAPVTTMQVAPTILRALGLDPTLLQSVQLEGTPVLPAVQF